MSTDTLPTIRVQREAVRASASIRQEWEAVKSIPDLKEREKEERRIRREHGSKMREAFVLEGPGGVLIKVPRNKAMFMADLREVTIEG